MRVHASYWKREKYPAPIATPFSRFIVSLPIQRPHAGPAPDAGHVEHCRAEKVRRRATRRSLQVREGIGADERTDVAQHVHRSRYTTRVLARDVRTENPAWTDRHIRSERCHG